MTIFIEGSDGKINCKNKGMSSEYQADRQTGFCLQDELEKTSFTSIVSHFAKDGFLKEDMSMPRFKFCIQVIF